MVINPVYTSSLIINSSNNKGNSSLNSTANSKTKNNTSLRRMFENTKLSSN